MGILPKMNKRRLFGLILIILAVSFVSWGFYDLKQNPECYNVNRTWSNIEQRYIEGNIIKSIYENRTEEKLPECYIIRSRVFNGARYFLIIILIYLVVDLLWFRLPKKKKEKMLKEFTKK